MTSILGLGVRSLLAYQSAITIAAQNMENANTPFYSRKEVSLVEAMFNNGVTISDVRRVFDKTANESLINRTSTDARLTDFYNRISDFEKLLDDDNSNINKYLNDSLESIQQLTSTVDSTESRSAYLTKLKNLANRFNDINRDIDHRKEEVNSSIKSNIERVNELEKEISKINTQVQSVGSADISSLLDQRNALVHELATYIDFKTYTDEKDNLTLSLSNGTEILSGGTYYKFSTQLNATDPGKLDIMLDNGVDSSNITSLLSDGSIVSMISFRSDVLDKAQVSLSRMSLSISEAFNKQNKLGVDANGDLGGNIFFDINDSLLTSSRVISNTQNTGISDMAVSITNTNALTTSDYEVTFTSSTDYTLKRKSDGSIVNSGTVSGFPHTITADGFSLQINSGTFVAGDKYTIKPTNNALTKMSVIAADSSKLALGYPVTGVPNINNMGDGKINIDSIIDTTNAAFSTNKALNPPIRIEFLSETSYQIVNANTNTVMEGPVAYDPSNGASIFPTSGSYDPGYRVSLSGFVKAGDSFTIDYNVKPAGDNRNALKLSDLYSNQNIENGSLTFSSAYRLLSSDVSLKTNTTRIESDSAISLKDQAEKKFYQISGVSLSEETGNLAMYQQSYQASAQIIQVAKTVFDTIIGLSRT